MSICPSRSRQLRLAALLCGTFLATTATMAPAWSASTGDSSRDASLVTVAQTSLTTPVFEDDSADTVSGSRDETEDRGVTESGRNDDSGSVSGSEGGGNGASDNSGTEDHGGGSQSGGSSGSGSGGGHGGGHGGHDD